MVAMEIKALFTLNEIMRIEMPKIKKDKANSDDREMPNHQNNDFIMCQSVLSLTRCDFF